MDKKWVLAKKNRRMREKLPHPFVKQLLQIIQRGLNHVPRRVIEGRKAPFQRALQLFAGAVAVSGLNIVLRKEIQRVDLRWFDSDSFVKKFLCLRFFMA